MTTPTILGKLVGSGNAYEQKIWVFAATDAGDSEEELLEWARTHTPKKGYVLDGIARTTYEVDVPPPPRKINEPFGQYTRVARPCLQFCFVHRPPMGNSTPKAGSTSGMVPGGPAIYMFDDKGVLDVGDNVARAIAERQAKLVLPP
jgi:hypothetical protein